MLVVYAVSALIAGVLVLLSFLGGDHDSEMDSGGHDADHEFWLPFFSLRFYTYFFAGFGATGLLLHFLTQTNSVTSAWISAAVGMLSGLGVSILIRLLKITETSGGANDKDVLGKEAKVMVAIRGSNPGQIRCTVRGDIIDFTAFTEEPEPIEAGETILVVAMENGKAQVVKHSSIFGEDALPQRTS